MRVCRRHRPGNPLLELGLDGSGVSRGPQAGFEPKSKELAFSRETRLNQINAWRIGSPRRLRTRWKSQSSTAFQSRGFHRIPPNQRLQPKPPPAATHGIPIHPLTLFSQLHLPSAQQLALFHPLIPPTLGVPSRQETTMPPHPRRPGPNAESKKSTPKPSQLYYFQHSLLKQNP